mmetsp:Transcript_24375/g.29473  ORF Transcript_24375/g.29473 Transcript_24375/m.29473 type:complete len:211 (+) Transcript_24375:717-1349(+)
MSCTDSEYLQTNALRSSSSCCRQSNHLTFWILRDNAVSRLCLRDERREVIFRRFYQYDDDEIGENGVFGGRESQRYQLRNRVPGLSDPFRNYDISNEYPLPPAVLIVKRLEKKRYRRCLSVIACLRLGKAPRAFIARTVLLFFYFPFPSRTMYQKRVRNGVSRQNHHNSRGRMNLARWVIGRGWYVRLEIRKAAVTSLSRKSFVCGVRSE